MQTNLHHDLPRRRPEGQTGLKALKVYEEKNVKFADAVMGYWGLEKGITIAYTYDEKGLRRIEGLSARKP